MNQTKSDDNIQYLDLSMLNEDLNPKYELEELVNKFVYIETKATIKSNGLYEGTYIGAKNFADCAWAVLVDSSYSNKADVTFTYHNKKDGNGNSISTPILECNIIYVKIDKIISIDAKARKKKTEAPTEPVNSKYEDFKDRYVRIETITPTSETLIYCGRFEGVRCLGDQVMLCFSDCDHFNGAEKKRCGWKMCKY